jgi:hypothetical protein
VEAVVVAETMVDRVAAAATAAVEAHTAGLAGANLDPRAQEQHNGIPTGCRLSLSLNAAMRSLSRSE